MNKDKQASESQDDKDFDNQVDALNYLRESLSGLGGERDDPHLLAAAGIISAQVLIASQLKRTADLLDDLADIMWNK